jgi:hypothetical protein
VEECAGVASKASARGGAAAQEIREGAAEKIPRD